MGGLSKHTHAQTFAWSERGAERGGVRPHLQPFSFGSGVGQRQTQGLSSLKDKRRLQGWLTWLWSACVSTVEGRHQWQTCTLVQSCKQQKTMKDFQLLQALSTSWNCISFNFPRNVIFALFVLHILNIFASSTFFWRLRLAFSACTTLKRKTIAHPQKRAEKNCFQANLNGLILPDCRSKSRSKANKVMLQWFC